MKAPAVAVLVLALAACSGAPQKPTPPAATRVEAPSPTAVATTPRRSPYAPAQEDPSKRGRYTPGGLYAPEIADSAPDGLPDVDLIPEPEVRAEPLSRYGNRSPYAVLGRTYTVLPSAAGYDETGLASFYGNKFHGRRTSNLEVYDMYAFSAAHKTLPLPSYARVTNLANGRSVVVRVNDRGPFHDGRIIDLSYAAAVKLGVDRAGTARVEVQGLAADEVPPPPLAVAAAPPSRPVAVSAPAGPPSAVDRLIAALPIAAANAGERPPQPAAPPATTDWRFDMRQDGHTMTADEFDAWMRARRARVATGRPGTPIAPSAPATVPVPAAPAPDRPVATTRASVPAPATDAAVGTPAGGTSPVAEPVVLQVASFAARANAEHALAMLTGAGIAAARLLDADANGRRVWRLRVGPVDAGAAPELAARIAGLGFGQPQRVRE
jgi:rare lipoprotein A